MIKKLNNRIRYEKFVLIYAVVMMLLFVFNSTLLSYSHQTISVGLRWLGRIARLSMIAAAVLKLATGRMSKTQVLFLGVFSIVFAAEYYFNRNWMLFDVMFAALAFYDIIDYHKLLSCFIIALAFSILAVAVLYCFNFFPEVQFNRGPARNRMYLGFGHPNSLSRAVLFLCLMVFVYRGEKNGFFELLFYAAAAGFTYYFPNSQTVTAILVILIALTVVSKTYSKLTSKKLIDQKAVKIILMLLVPIITAAVYYVTITGKSVGTLQRLSESFAARFTLGKIGLDRYGVHLFGTRGIPFVSSAEAQISGNPEYFMLDNLYIYLPVVYGLVVSVFFAAAYICCIYNSIVKRNSYLAAVLALLAVFSVAESGVNSYYFAAFFTGALVEKKNEA